MLKMKMELRNIKEDDGKKSVFIYIKNYLSKDEIEKYICELDKIDDYKLNHNFDHTKIIRLQKWYHTENKYFCPKWKYKYDRWNCNKYECFLLQLQNKVQDDLIAFELDKLKVKIPKINSCLLNKYRDGSDYIRAHHDTELTFGKYPTIIGLSLGSNRNIIFKRKVKAADKLNEFKFTLETGSIFIMAGSSQKYYTHEVPRTETSDIRYSLTFRETI